MHNKLLSLFTVLGVLYLCSCAQTTNSMFKDDRSQLLLVSEEELNQEAKQAYDEVINQAKANKTLNADKKFYSRVSSISDRLIKVAPELRPDCKDWAWEINTIKDPTVNAWCMPGGKICVYTGLNDALNLNDDELASIIGHEISHALKEHSREKRSQAAVQSGLTSVAKLLGIKDETANLANSAYNVAFAMPFSRDQESESDKYGLELIYKAGFDPQGSVNAMKKLNEFEKKAQAAEKTGSNIARAFVNRLTSTHPASEERYQALQKLIDENHLTKLNRDTK
ncbi:MAG: M48 family metallopeptidase [Succinivibrio sp.]